MLAKTKSCKRRKFLKWKWIHTHTHANARTHARSHYKLGTVGNGGSIEFYFLIFFGILKQRLCNFFTSNFLLTLCVGRKLIEKSLFLVQHGIYTCQIHSVHIYTFSSGNMGDFFVGHSDKKWICDREEKKTHFNALLLQQYLNHCNSIANTFMLEWWENHIDTELVIPMKYIENIIRSFSFGAQSSVLQENFECSWQTHRHIHTSARETLHTCTRIRIRDCEWNMHWL